MSFPMTNPYNGLAIPEVGPRYAHLQKNEADAILVQMMTLRNLFYESGVATGRYPPKDQKQPPQVNQMIVADVDRFYIDQRFRDAKLN